MRLELVTDPAGVQRQLGYDGLGRLVQAYEVGPGYVTNYTYDMLDNLTDVSMPQQGQTRHFTYNSLKRLLTANNPESNSAITYVYDANGNVVMKTDARNVITCWGNLSGTSCDQSGYDALNRPVKVSYSDGTPGSVFCYDGASYVSGSCSGSAGGQKMRRTGAGNSVSGTNYTFDVAGRLVSSTQTTGGVPYPFSYSYYQNDAQAGMAMPSGETVTTCYDSNQRPIWVSEVQTAANCTGVVISGQMIATVGNFTPLGQIASMSFGSGLTESSSYNNRGQMTGRTALFGGVSRVALGMYYCPSQGSVCGTNNGNVQSTTVGYGASGSESAFSATQNYLYDLANRLKQVVEGSAYQTYNYDPAGNRWVPANVGYPSLSNLTPTVQGNFIASSNRLAGVGYDAAGNQTQLNPFTLGYDAENRMTNAAGGSSGSGSYGYDADGRRVTKSANGVGTVFVYDGFGELTAEYGGTSGASGMQYVTQDHLGSTRLVTDAGGNVVRRYDYLPFGEALPAGFGGRSSMYSVGAFPVAGDGWSEKFTGKERDAETGLDYFGARYMSSAQGRFTSPDEVFWGQRRQDPQSWNLYTYAGNNPLRYVGPDGHDYHVCADNGNGGQNCRDLSDSQYNNLYKQQDGQQGIGLPGSWLGGSITCGGQVCGSASYFERSIESETASIGVGLIGGKALGLVLGRVGGWVAGYFGRTASSTVELNPGSILFSQRSVSGVEDIAASMRANGWSGAPVDVVRLENGGLVTVDNTRVLAASQTGTKVQAIVHDASDALPPSQIQRFTTSQGAPSTWGEAAQFRIQNQGAGFRNAYPNGSPVTGVK